MRVYTKAVLGEWLTLARERGFFGGRAAISVPESRTATPTTEPRHQPERTERANGGASARLSK